MIQMQRHETKLTDANGIFIVSIQNTSRKIRKDNGYRKQIKMLSVLYCTSKLLRYHIINT